MDLKEILAEIKKAGLEDEVLQYLFHNRFRAMRRAEIDKMVLEHKIECIHKLNAGKNEAIDAMCEPDDEQIKKKRYELLNIAY